MIDTDIRAVVLGVIGSLLAAAIGYGISLMSTIPPVAVPLWVIAAIIGGPMVWAMVRQYLRKKMTIYVDKTFSHDEVALDGMHFIRCKFDRSRLVYRGLSGFSFEHCNFTAPTFSFKGSAAQTINQLRVMRTDPSFSHVLDGILNSAPENGDTEQFSASDRH